MAFCRGAAFTSTGAEQYKYDTSVWDKVDKGKSRKQDDQKEK
jgi:hypothetical protein